MASSLASSLTLLLAAASAFTQAEAAGPGTFHPRGASYGAVDLETRDDALSSSSNALINRGTDQAPDGYVPASVSCPSDRPTIRNGTTLSPQEREWLPKRRNETIAPIRELLARIGIPDFDSDAYLRNVENDARALPNIGLAVSGGGYRAMLNGAGALAAWDSRTDGSTEPGNLGGLLQSATYLSGLSGGGWLVGSLMMNNFTSVQKSVNYGGIWQMENSIFEGPDQYSIKAYYTRIFEAVSEKKDAGYERSLTDYWGRMLSYQLINATDGGPGFTWSSLADDPDFSEGKTPLPILIADGRAPDEKIIALNATVFEFSPWELGSFDPTLHGFVPLKYVGSKFDNGEIPDNETCIRGFDNAGFVMGTSSSLFNQIVMYLNDPNSGYVSDKVPKIAIEAISALLEGIGDDNDDIADWTPNPFKGWNEAENLSVDSERLTLVDGGEDLQNVPYYPHIRLDRKVDVVFSVDSSADTESGWPDGASAIATYERSLEDIANGSAFPVVPGKATFRNLGFNTKPTFFGCNATNTSDPAPLIVYIPNYPYVYASNISTFQMTVNTSELTAIIENGYAVATQLNATRDADWPYCVGCAMLSRSFDRTNASVPAKCRECFTNYCWNGTLDESEPAPYWPEFISTPLSVQGFGTRVVSSSFGLVVAIVVGVFIAF